MRRYRQWRARRRRYSGYSGSGGGTFFEKLIDSFFDALS